MVEGKPAAHRELWQAVSVLPQSQGPEADLKMWEEAEAELDALCTRYENEANEAVHTALVDAYNRCIEERRRAEDLLKLHEKRANRGIRGVVEPAE